VNDLWRTFFALGDPHRLSMIRRLAEKGPQSMVRLTEGMEFTRQAGARHVTVLRDAGLVSLNRKGREQVISLERHNLHLSQMFMKQMEETWDDRLAKLQEFLG
jgi:DNA-binding transcriptional ArsR family regulator